MFICACSDIGKMREINQDAYYYLDDEKLPIFIVADGMGGHKAGEIASNSSLRAVKEVYEKYKEKILNKEVEIAQFINESIKRANEEIRSEAEKEPSFKGMGTTLTMGIVFEKEIYIGHVGDSRAYLLRNKELVQITHDHSLVAELVRAGTITEEEAIVHPQKNIITRALGTDKEVEADIVTRELLEGDIILLCTDGLTNMVSNPRIKEIILNSSNLTDVCTVLANTANELGGIDNTTVMVLKVG
ncbi:serine/threonine phosphatase Stp [Gottschalkia purinilytica]|uniref:Serine/threonine phosphatase Stp n=1 Tax=Gottschalkia purinilytica TaxID=1503 RepID=A0A0L0WB37_GOTPU|nr:Stp1/IreP family PP2C-type Ser/Thr phosphatase [Gottschalkia purinilytica]KNF08744.1 serine/threonine phosphatase Stp [Gottschalkia purinilytica]